MKKNHLVAILIFLNINLYAQKTTFNPSEIEIIRDSFGVPHIYAPTDAQVSYGLAWAHSEDDFETIQMTVMAAKQLLGRHLGKEGAPIDYVVGLLRVEDIVNAHIDKFSPTFMKIVEGYAAGLNAYAKYHPEEVLLKRTFPVSLQEIVKAYVLQLAVQDGGDRVIQNLFNNKIELYQDEVKGSNAFAINRNKTTDGNVFLAINSHQPLEGPAAWYEAHLVSDEGWNMMGGLFPGGPVIFHGTNEYLGWAHTVNYFDKVDVFELEMHPKEKYKYRIDEEWFDLEKRKVKLKVKLLLGLKIGIKKDAYYSKYGPVVKNSTGTFAFKMAVFDEIRAVEQWYKMNKATNLTEFKEAMNMTAILSFNTVYADRENNIFYVSNGKIPMRNPKYNWDETVPGNTSSTLSSSYHPFDDLPQITNPASGYLFNTNNTPFNATASPDNIPYEDYDTTMGFNKNENNRSTRFMELIAQYDKLNWEDFQAIKYDGTLPDSLLFGINLNPLFSMQADTSSKASEILTILQSWDKSTSIDQVGPAHLLLTYDYLKRDKDIDDISNVSDQQMIKALRSVNHYLITHFGKVDVSLGEYQKLVRGEKEYPLGGFPDVLTAMYSKKYKNGMVSGMAGESYIMMVRYPEQGLPIIEATNVYGASNKAESPHYDDQMGMFVNQQRRPMTLDLVKVRKNAERIYSPK
jgi:acyl-homoserine-lactone acylase